MSMLRVAVIDGQGGGVGKALVEGLRSGFGREIHIIALGSNSIATSQMMKAGADEGATGENAVATNAGRVDVIMGALGILSADAMLGEITPAMAAAVGRSDAEKILIPLNRCNLTVAGIKEMSFSEYVEDAIHRLQTTYKSTLGL